MKRKITKQLTGAEWSRCHLLDDSSPQTCCALKKIPVSTQFCCLYLWVLYSFGLDCMRSQLSVLVLAMTTEIRWHVQNDFSTAACLVSWQVVLQQDLSLWNFPGCCDKSNYNLFIRLWYHDEFMSSSVYLKNIGKVAEDGLFEGMPYLVAFLKGVNIS